jgi:predicted nucleic acid-binding protein
MRVYLDTCCLNRPFDSQAQDRVRLESEAVTEILRQASAGVHQLVRSTAIELELGRMSDADRRARVLEFLDGPGWLDEVPTLDAARATRLVGLGFKPLDALHVAAAEASSADVFLTTDDRLLHTARRHSGDLKVRVQNPADWLLEVR